MSGPISGLTPEQLVSQEDSEDGAELSGVGGIIQPLPHDPNSNAFESLILLRSRAEHGQ